MPAPTLQQQQQRLQSRLHLPSGTAAAYSATIHVRTLLGKVSVNTVLQHIGSALMLNLAIKF